MRPDERHDDQGSDDSGRPRADIAGTGSAPQTREEEAHDTRAGRPMPEEDAANRTEHHKGSYGGEHGEPREKPDEPGKGATGAK
jgi:hypothetical protein